MKPKDYWEQVDAKADQLKAKYASRMATGTMTGVEDIGDSWVHLDGDFGIDDLRTLVDLLYEMEGWRKAFELT